jgi:hypothetical protein
MATDSKINASIAKLNVMSIVSLIKKSSPRSQFYTKPGRPRRGAISGNPWNGSTTATWNHVVVHPANNTPTTIQSQMSSGGHDFISPPPSPLSIPQGLLQSNSLPITPPAQSSEQNNGFSLSAAIVDDGVNNIESDPIDFMYQEVQVQVPVPEEYINQMVPEEYITVPGEYINQPVSEEFINQTTPFINSVVSELMSHANENSDGNDSSNNIVSIFQQVLNEAIQTSSTNLQNGVINEDNVVEDNVVEDNVVEDNVVEDNVAAVDNTAAEDNTVIEDEESDEENIFATVK